MSPNWQFLFFFCIFGLFCINCFAKSQTQKSPEFVHPYADFIAKWNSRSQMDHFCFFSPMNCPVAKTHPYKAMVRQDELPDFLRALNAHRQWLEAQKKQKEQVRKKPRGTRRKLAVEYERKKMRMMENGRGNNQN